LGGLDVFGQPPGGGHVDVEALVANDFARVVSESLTVDDDFVGLAADVDDAVAGIDRTVGAANLGQGGGDLGVVVGVFVRITCSVVGCMSVAG
jgi:hypothetical protein